MQLIQSSVSQLLRSNSDTFFIPPFQRSYEWGKQELERYFADLSRIIDSELNPNDKDKVEHFLGTVFIKKESEGLDDISIIIDGQQRLTTTLIFLIALRDLESDTKRKNYITNMFLTNNNSQFTDKIKLKQVTKDWDEYKALVNKKSPVPGKLTNAYNVMKNLIINNNKKNSLITFDNYITAIRRMNLAVITLDNRSFKGEDPQIIFEMLNSLGRPLTLADLVRNFILLKINPNEQSDLYDKKWYPQIEKYLDDSTSDFLRNYLQLKTSKPCKEVNDNNNKELYAQFKDLVGKYKIPELIDEIAQYAKCYKLIITENNSEIISKDSFKNAEIKELLRNIFHDIKSEEFKPLVMGLLAANMGLFINNIMSDEVLTSNLNTIKIYLIRRRILGLTQGENTTIVTFCSSLEDFVIEGELLRVLMNLKSDLRFPDDNELKDTLISKDFYNGCNSYARFILGKIEERNSKIAVDFRSKKITIEHIMPQNISNSDWRNGFSDKDEIRKKYLHNIGNLILTEFNSEMGNKEFKFKQNKLKDSNLFYRHFILEQDRWDEFVLKKHQDKMIEWLIETFPVSDKYKKGNNFRSELSKDDDWVSIFDSDIKEIVKGNKPEFLKINDEEFAVKSWRDVFISFLSFIRRKNDFVRILNNQNEILGKSKNTIIMNYETLRPHVEDNEQIAERYKSFDGVLLKNMKNINQDELFVFVNMNAETIISKIAKIMNELYLDQSLVKVKIK